MWLPTSGIAVVSSSLASESISGIRSKGVASHSTVRLINVRQAIWCKTVA